MLQVACVSQVNKGRPVVTRKGYVSMPVRRFLLCESKHPQHIDPMLASLHMHIAMIICLLQGWGVPAFKEATRDTHTFSRRVGALPVQKEDDNFDFRPLLHR